MNGNNTGPWINVRFTPAAPLVPYYSVDGTGAPFAASFVDGVMQQGSADASFYENFAYSSPDVGTMRDWDGTIKWAPHNLVASPASPATQSVTVVSGVEYTVGCNGGGSVVLSGAGSGTATQGTRVSFTASGTTLTLTVTGSPTEMWAYRSDLGGMVDVPADERTAGLRDFVDFQGARPRWNHFEYDGSDFINKGLLHEGVATTNLIPNPLDFSDGWLELNSNATVNNAISPTGKMDAVTVAHAGGNVNPRFYKVVPITAGDHVFSVHADATQHRYVQLLFHPDISDEYVNFDLQALTFNTGDKIAATIEDIGNDQRRISITFNATASPDRFVFLKLAGSLSDARNSAYNGNTSQQVNFWGPQLEAGRLLTAFTPDTRAAQTIRLLNAALGTFTDFSLSIKGTANYIDNSETTAFTFYEWGSDASNRVRMFMQTAGADTGQAVLEQELGGVPVQISTAATKYAPGPSTPFDIAVTHTATDVQAAFEQTSITGTTSAPGMPDLSAVNLDMLTNFCGTIERILFIPSDIGTSGREAVAVGQDFESHAFLVSGQSNAIGWVDADSGPQYPANTFQYTQSGAIAAAAPEVEHREDRNANVSQQFTMSFAAKYLLNNPRVNLYFIGNAEGGTGYGQGDHAVGGAIHESTVTRANAFMAALPTAQFKGALVHMGERDSQQASWRSAFEASFQAARADYATRVTGFDANTPFVFGGLVPNVTSDLTAMTNVIAALPSTNTGVGFASSDGLNDTDGLHFDAASQHALGPRYFDALQDALANI